MKYIYLNLKRFDVPKSEGGANDIASANEWGVNIVEGIARGVEEYDDIAFAAYLPEGYIMSAANANHGKLAKKTFPSAETSARSRRSVPQSRLSSSARRRLL